VLQCGAVYCSVLQCFAVRYSVVDAPWLYSAIQRSVMQCVVVCYSVLPCVAVCCSVLQRVAVCHSVVDAPLLYSATTTAPITLHKRQAARQGCNHPRPRAATRPQALVEDKRACQKLWKETAPPSHFDAVERNSPTFTLTSGKPF